MIPARAERDGRMPVAAPLGLPAMVMAGGQILTLEFVLWHKLGHKLGESGATVSLTWADVSSASESRRELCWLLCRKTR
jgi:hypothetical protein